MVRPSFSGKNAINELDEVERGWKKFHYFSEMRAFSFGMDFHLQCAAAKEVCNENLHRCWWKDSEKLAICNKNLLETAISQVKYGLKQVQREKCFQQILAKVCTMGVFL